MMNNGPELLVKLRSLSASISLQIPRDLKSATILAPIGYPLIVPISRANAPSPGTLNIGRINFFRALPKNGTTEVVAKRFVAMKKGNSAGTTEPAQRAKPRLCSYEIIS